jgi:osmotically-inducible protein OsmY
MGAMGSDRGVIQQVNQRLASRGIRNPCKIDVTSKNGEVTLTGSIQYPQQRATAMHAASTASGVRHVVDRMTIKPPAKRT